jgi:hypothetical protein
MRARRSLPQDSVGVFRDVFDLHTGHGAIVAPIAPKCKCEEFGVGPAHGEEIMVVGLWAAPRLTRNPFRHKKFGVGRCARLTATADDFATHRIKLSL